MKVSELIDALLKIDAQTAHDINVKLFDVSYGGSIQIDSVDDVIHDDADGDVVYINFQLAEDNP